MGAYNAFRRELQRLLGILNITGVSVSSELGGLRPNASIGYSGTGRELAAVERSLASFRHHMTGRALLWHCDNAAAVRILQCGSSKSHLQLYVGAARRRNLFTRSQ